MEYFLHIFFIITAIFVLHFIGRRMIFKKAGIEGWKSVIPIYTGYLFFKLAWRARFFLHVFIINIFVSICRKSNKIFFKTIGSMIIPLGTIIMLIYWIKLNMELSKKFEKGIGFTLGLIVLNPIFMLILCFEKNKYSGNPEEYL